MKQKIRFLLRSPNCESKTAIYMLYSFRYKDEKGRYKPLKYYTGNSIDPNNWDAESMKAKGKYASSINANLKEIEFEADKIYNKYYDDNLTPNIFKQKLDVSLNRVDQPKINKTDPMQNIINYLNKYIGDIESGRRRTFKDATRKFSPSTITNIKSFKKKLKEYQAENRIKVTFNDVDLKFYQRFVTWLATNHAKNTIGKFIKQLKMIMQAAFDDDIHTNLSFKKKGFKVITELVDTIYLTEDEIDLIFNYKAKGGIEKARKIFLVGCFTLQRVSDYTRISKEHISLTTNGIPVIRLKQVKTGTNVIIPFIDPRLVGIMEDYNYKLPKLSEQKINIYIKEICKAVGIEKYMKVTTHTARRSGCTNMYHANIPTGKIMKISGHKTEQEFRKYIRVTDEENAEDLANHKFFKRQIK